MKFLNSALRSAAIAAIVSATFAAASAGTPNPDSVRPLAELSERLGMPNLAKKLDGGKNVKIAYLGGSITEQNGWRVHSRKYLERKYPKARVGEINAAIGGTGSDLGCLRVGADVIAKNPDAVFVEFAVNDAWRNPREIFRDMEGIVRQIWAKSGETDICFVYTVTERDAAALENGEMSRAASAMEALADYYGIPSIHFGKEIAENLASGNLVMKTGADVKYVDGEALDENAAIARTPDGKIPFSKDGVHPYPNTGHLLYQKAFARCFDALAKSSKSAAGAARARSLPAADPMSPASVKTLPLDAAKLFGKTGDVPWNSPAMSEKFKKRAPFGFKKFEEGSGFEIEFSGKRLVMYALFGPSCGEAYVRADSEKTRKAKFFDGYSSYYRMMPVKLFDGARGEHCARLEMSAEKMDKRAMLLPEHAKRFDDNPSAFAPQDAYACCLYIVE